MTSKPGGVGANVAKFCRDAARNSVLDTNNKAQGVLRSVAEWHEKKSVELLSGKLDRERRLESMKQERKYQDRTLIRQRQERMKEVLQSEQRQYERELEGLGLSSSHMDLAYKVG